MMKEAELAGRRFRVDEPGEGTVGAPIRAVCTSENCQQYAIKFKVVKTADLLK
jgi:hypothetical protein